jgi:hypothetical protein
VEQSTTRSQKSFSRKAQPVQVTYAVALLIVKREIRAGEQISWRYRVVRNTGVRDALLSDVNVDKYLWTPVQVTLPGQVESYTIEVVLDSKRRRVTATAASTPDDSAEDIVESAEGTKEVSDSTAEHLKEEFRDIVDAKTFDEMLTMCDKFLAFSDMTGDPSQLAGFKGKESALQTFDEDMFSDEDADEENDDDVEEVESPPEEHTQINLDEGMAEEEEEENSAEEEAESSEDAESSEEIEDSAEKADEDNHDTESDSDQ